MDAYGQLRSQRCVGADGKLLKHGPLYPRSISVRDLNAPLMPLFKVNWTRKDSCTEGYLEFSREDARGCIQSTRIQRTLFDGTFLDKVSTEHNSAGKFKVTSEPFYPVLRRLLRKGTDWGVDFTFNVLAEFAPGLMEWTEEMMEKHEHLLRQADIYGLVAASRFPYMYVGNVWRAFCELWGPLTNTFHHAGGELGISLNDMKQIGGLPILGDLYEEFLPPNVELSNAKKYPPTVLELLCIHADLCKHMNTEEISWWKWLAHFFRGDKIYASFGEDFAERSAISSMALETQSDSLVLDKELLPLVVSEEGLFAAFLALLLNRFVLPEGAKTIRPESFVMACFLAEGRKISLAPVALGHIYHGLNRMATHPSHPGRANPSFGIHFVIGWMAEYFPCLYRCRPSEEFPADYPRLVRYAGVVGNQLNIHQARSVLRHSKHVLYRRIPFGEEVGVDHIDTEDISNAQFERLLCIRSGVLAVRVGSTLISEPYYVNRFGRQLGFDQGVPSNHLQFLNPLRKRQTLEDLARHYWNFYQKNTGALFHIPRSNYHGKCTWSYCSWWVASSTPYLSQSISKVNVTLTKKNTHLRDNNYVLDDVRKVVPDLKGAVRVFSRSQSVDRASSEEPLVILPSKRKVLQPSSPDVNFKRRKDYRQSETDMADLEVRWEDDIDATPSLVADDILSKGVESSSPIALNEAVVVVAPTKASSSTPKSNSQVSSFPSLRALFTSQREYLRPAIVSGMRNIVKIISAAHTSEDPSAVRDDVYIDLNVLQVTAAAAGVDSVSLSWFSSQIDKFFNGLTEVTQLESEFDTHLMNETSSILSLCTEELTSAEKELAAVIDESQAAKEREKQISDMETKLQQLKLVDAAVDKKQLKKKHSSLKKTIQVKQEEKKYLEEKLQTNSAKSHQLNLKKGDLEVVVRNLISFNESG